MRFLHQSNRCFMFRVQILQRHAFWIWCISVTSVHLISIGFFPRAWISEVWMDTYSPLLFNYSQPRTIRSVKEICFSIFVHQLKEYFFQMREKPILYKDINGFITCSLCNGYLIDAATIPECLHTCMFNDSINIFFEKSLVLFFSF